MCQYGSSSERSSAAVWGAGITETHRAGSPPVWPPRLGVLASQGPPASAAAAAATAAAHGRLDAVALPP